MGFTLLDLKKLDDGIGYDIIEENISMAPELRIIPADTLSGISMTLTVRTDLPTVAFRNINEGVARSKSKYETRQFQTATLDHQVAVDTQLTANMKDPSRLFSNHASGAVEAAFRHIGKQFYYGTGNDAKGFPGLVAQMSADATHLTSSTATTAKSSVYFIRVGKDTIEFLFGNGTTINFQQEWQKQTVLDANNNPYQAWVNWMTGNVGMRLANKNAAVRLSALGADTDTGKTLTYSLMWKAWNLFVEFGWEPTHILMNGRSQNQLRLDGATDLIKDPPMPTQFNGVPIIRTASISSAETI